MWNGTLAELAALDESPTSDGILGEWTRERATAPFTAADVASLVALVRAPDPHLQEAGVELATAALRSSDVRAPHVPDAAIAMLEAQLVALVAPETDPYVLEALVGLLEEHEVPGLFAALARVEPSASASRFPPPGPPPTSYPPPPRARARFIMRNRMAEPWRWFRALAAARVR